MIESFLKATTGRYLFHHFARCWIRINVFIPSGNKESSVLVAHDFLEFCFPITYCGQIIQKSHIRSCLYSGWNSGDLKFSICVGSLGCAELPGCSILCTLATEPKSPVCSKSLPVCSQSLGWFKNAYCGDSILKIQNRQCITLSIDSS